MKINGDKMQSHECFKEAIDLVIIDGICLGIDTAGESEQTAIINACQNYLQKLVETHFSADEAMNVDEAKLGHLENTES